MSSSQPSPQISCLNSTEISPPAGHYSHVCTAAGLVYVSGQLPVDAQGKPLSDQPFEVQATQVLKNIDACLRTAGASREDLVQVRVFVTDIAAWPIFNRIYADWIGDHKPARAVAESSALHFGAGVEVEAIALQPSK